MLTTPERDALEPVRLHIDTTERTVGVPLPEHLIEPVHKFVRQEVDYWRSHWPDSLGCLEGGMWAFMADAFLTIAEPEHALLLMPDVPPMYGDTPAHFWADTIESWMDAERDGGDARLAGELGPLWATAWELHEDQRERFYNDDEEKKGREANQH